MEKVFKWRHSSISYAIYGDGKLPLVAFHGYGQDKSSFLPLVPALRSKYTVFAIDLPYHGYTRWREKEALKQEELEELTDAFIRETNMRGPINLMGYSIGGNFVLGLVQRCPEKVGEVWLIAADGLSPKPWFNFITKTLAGRWLFRAFVAFPQLVFALLWLSIAVHIMPERVARFFMYNIDSREKRKMLYRRWRSVSGIRGNLQLVKKEVNNYNIPVYLIFGKNDGVISAEYAKKFALNLPGAQLILTEQGHQMMDEETNLYVNELLNSNQKKART